MAQGRSRVGGDHRAGGFQAFHHPKYAGLPANFTVTHYPSIYLFLPPKDKATGVAMVVAPGGGHTQLVIDKEGFEIADWLNSMGIAAFVLKYRLARAPGSKYTLPGEVYADAARSVRLVRSRAAEWGVDPAKIGFIGFSAGGEVTGMIETQFDAGKPDAADPVERVSSRPDFTVSVYPAYRPEPTRRGPILRSSPCPKTLRRPSWCAPMTIARTSKPRSASISSWRPEDPHRDAHLRLWRSRVRSAPHQESQRAGDGLARAAQRVDGRARYHPLTTRRQFLAAAAVPALAALAETRPNRLPRSRSGASTAIARRSAESTSNSRSTR